MKSECPTFLRSKGKPMAITLSDDEIFDNESGSDEDGKYCIQNFTISVSCCKGCLIPYGFGSL